VPNRVVDVNSWTRSACYPRRTFYPMSDGPSIRDHRITKTNFRSCSRCLSHSQAPLCLCTQRLVSNQPEGTFARLRYSLGGDRPSQTTRQTMSPAWLHRFGIRVLDYKGWYFKGGSTHTGVQVSKPPTYPTHHSPKSNVKL
jgi:hypothetical protein